MSSRIVFGLIFALTSIGFAVAAPGPAPAIDVNELARCAAISKADARLQCYDAFATATVPGLGTVNSTHPLAAGALAAAASQSVPAAQPGPSAPPVAANATSAPPVSFNPDDPANFGLNPHQLKVSSKGPDAIKAVVSTLTEDRLNHVYLLLDNEQTWSLLDPDPHVRPGDSVSIKRASLGSFLLLTPSRRSYRVERVR